ncbi:MAG TPA: glycosyltransferase [Fervidobacterium nodosum]|nr:glycosyltransferase [Fervidobacterium nodosum]
MNEILNLLVEIKNEENLERVQIKLEQKIKTTQKMNIEEYILFAMIKFKKKEFEECLKILNQAEEIDTYHFGVNLLKACTLDSIKKHNEANNIFIKSMIIAPNNEIRKKILEIFSERYPELKMVESFLNKVINGEIKILHGTMEIANQMYTYTSGLKKYGAYARSINYYPSYLKYKNDMVINYHQLQKPFIESLIKDYSLFHFHFGTSLLPDNSDLPFLKSIKKYLLMQYWGSEARRISLVKKFNPYAISKITEESEIEKKLYYISKYINNAIVEDLELYECIKEFHNKIHFVRQAIDINKYNLNDLDDNILENKENIHKKKIRIVHAPTNPEFKGTKYIVNAIENLKIKHNNNIEFILISGVSHDEAKKIYQSADIIVDQLHAGVYGLFAIESMALGKPVVGWIADYFLKSYPKELPIIRANPDSIEKVLEELIKNREILPEIGMNSRKYVEKYHNIEKIKFDLLMLYYKIYREE